MGAIEARGSCAAARYRDSSSKLRTRSRLFSSGNNLILIIDSSMPHSTAKRRIRRRICNSRLMLVILSPSVCRLTMYACTVSAVISLSLVFASSANSESLRMPPRYQTAVLGFSRKVDSTHGWNVCDMNSTSVGEGFRSRIPTSPLARLVLWADSICRAILSFPCFILESPKPISSATESELAAKHWLLLDMFRNAKGPDERLRLFAQWLLAELNMRPEDSLGEKIAARLSSEAVRRVNRILYTICILAGW